MKYNVIIEQDIMENRVCILRATCHSDYSISTINSNLSYINLKCLMTSPTFYIPLI